MLNKVNETFEISKELRKDHRLIKKVVETKCRTVGFFIRRVWTHNLADLIRKEKKITL